MAFLETLLVGRPLASRYTVREPLGRGGMGAVFKAYDERLKRWVALKIVSVSNLSAEQEERSRRRFEREARLAAGLSHPNVVVVHDFGIDDGFGIQYLVMELLSGKNLKTRVADDGRLSTSEALRFVGQAARGVAAGHRAGLVHRDIKPENLFLTDQGERIVVLDFGIALETANGQTVTQLTLAEIGPHSPAYAAPEQLKGASITAATDVFCLAATAFELFTGRHVAPPGGNAGDEAALLIAQRYLDQHIDEFPAGVHAALKRSLALHPGDRPRDAAAFLEVFEQTETVADVENQTRRKPERQPERQPVTPAPSGRYYSREAFYRAIKRSLGTASFPPGLNAVETEYGYSRDEILRVGRELGINLDQLRLAMSEEDVRSPLPDIQSGFGQDGVCSQWIVPAGRNAVEPALLEWMLQNRDFVVSRRSPDAIAWKRATKHWPEVDRYGPTANGLHYVRTITTAISAIGPSETLVRLDAEIAVRNAVLKAELKRKGSAASEDTLKRARDHRLEPTLFAAIITLAFLALALWIPYAFDLVTFDSIDSWKDRIGDFVSGDDWRGGIANLFPFEPIRGGRDRLAVVSDLAVWVLFVISAYTVRDCRQANAMKASYRTVRDARKLETREAFQEAFHALSQVRDVPGG